MRRHAPTRPGPPAAATHLLSYVAPYHWTAMLAFLAARAVPATEQVDAASYRRSMRATAAGRAGGGSSRTATAGSATAGSALTGTVTVSNDPVRQALRVELSPGLAAGAADALERIGRMFDLGCDPHAVTAALGDLAGPDVGLRLPGAVDPFEIVVRAILGQQVTVAAARTMAARFVACFGTELPRRPGAAGVQGPAACGPCPSHLFPLAGSIAALDAARLGEIGIIRTRAEAIVATARALSSGRLHLVGGAAVAPTLASLTAIRGIGPWTAHYIAMRTIGWADAFPPGDVVVLKALRAATPAAAAAIAERWRPWRAYAVLHLWRRMGVSAT